VRFVAQNIFPAAWDEKVNLDVITLRG